MAIEVTERWSDRKYVRGESADRSFDVTGVTNDEDALRAAGVPIIGESHQLSSLLTCQQPQVSHPDGPLIFLITCHYVNDNGITFLPTKNPFSEPAEITWRIGSTSEDFSADALGNPFISSSGDPFENGVSRNITTLFLTVTRNESFFDLEKSLIFSNSVNSRDMILGEVFKVKKGQCLCSSIQPSGPYKAFGPKKPYSKYVNMQYDFEFRYDGFDVRVKNESRVGWWSDSGTLRSGDFCKKLNGTLARVSNPVLIDETGMPLDSTITVAGSNPARPSPTEKRPVVVRVDKYPNCVFLVFKGYKDRDLIGLNL